MSVDIVPHSPLIFQQNQLMSIYFSRTITLSYRDLLYDKLSRRTRSDLEQIRQTLNRNQGQTESNLTNLKFPSYITTCGHLHDFFQILDYYNHNQKWLCPSCNAAINDLMNIKVCKQSDLFIPKKEDTKRNRMKPELNNITRQIQSCDKQLNNLQEQISELKLADHCHTNFENSINLNEYKIENYLSDLSIDKGVSKNLISPISLKPQENRSNLSTNSSVQGNMLQPFGGSRKSLKKMFEKLSNNEFKVPSPRYVNKEQHKERNQSIQRDQNIFKNSMDKQAYTNLKKRNASQSRNEEGFVEEKFLAKTNKKHHHYIADYEVAYTSNKRQRFN